MTNFTVFYLIFVQQYMKYRCRYCNIIQDNYGHQCQQVTITQLDDSIVWMPTIQYSFFDD